MSEVDSKAKSTKAAIDRDVVWSPELPAREKVRPRLRIVPVLITLATVGLAAAAFGWTMWDAYMRAAGTCSFIVGARGSGRRAKRSPCGSSVRCRTPRRMPRRMPRSR